MKYLAKSLGALRLARMEFLYKLHLRFRKVHDTSYLKSPLYRKVSDSPYTRPTRNAVVGAFATSLVFFIFVQFIFPSMFNILSPRKVMAGANDKTWTTKGDLTSGSADSNVTISGVNPSDDASASLVSSTAFANNNLLGNVPNGRSNHTTVWTGLKMIVWGGNSGSTKLNTGGIYDPVTDSWTATNTTGAPDARQNHTAIWTGSKMIVWGGLASGNLMTGGIYDPITDAWTATNTTNAPNGRYYHTAIWTGTKMIVWGGYNGGAFNTGGIYDPSTDTWTATSIIDAPTARYMHTAVWTGSKMIIWGGSPSLNTGGIYDPIADTWTATSIGTNVPTGRFWHTAVWAGTKMIIWGGSNTGVNTGGVYDLATDSWTATSIGANVPSARYQHTAIWTGSKMAVWGGYATLNTGALYDPTADSWTTINTTNVPSGRIEHTAIWTGTKMIVWGGSGLNTGGAYNPDANTWSAVRTILVDPGKRSGHTAVWTGSKMIIWGGYTGSSFLSTGFSYDKTIGTWAAISGVNAPTARFGHTAVWTGSKMIVWGGYAGGAGMNTGGIYDPTTDTWTVTSIVDVPSGRSGHIAVWSGAKMVVWGGSAWEAGAAVNTGGIYDPVANTWTATSIDNTPLARRYPTAVWTGSKMIVWGGIGNSGSTVLNTGGAYDPTANTWTATSIGANVPAARYYHTAIWTGNKMIVWGGNVAGTYSNTGSSYDPTTDTWSTTSTVSAPAVRQSHTAIWTGTRMIIWGGSGGSSNIGGSFDPTANSWTALSAVNAPQGREYATVIWTGANMIIFGGSINGNTVFFGDGGIFSNIYSTPGVISSLVFSGNQGTKFNWKTLAWSGSVPTGTSIIINLRTSDDGSTWSSWSPGYTISTGNDIGALAPTRYIEAKVTLNADTIQEATPTLNDFTISYDSLDSPVNTNTNILKLDNSSLKDATGTAIAAGISGGWTNETSVKVVTTGLACTDCTNAMTNPYIEVESKPVGTAFDGTTNITVGAVDGGNQSTATVTGLAAGTGYHFQMRTKDAQGRASSWTPYGTIPDNVNEIDAKVEQTVPTGTVSINSDAPFATSTSVTLTPSATDTGGSNLSQMRFSNDGTTWSAWETYATTKAWTLTSGDATKTVYAQFRDNAGNISGKIFTSQADWESATRQNIDTTTSIGSATLGLGGDYFGTGAQGNVTIAAGQTVNIATLITGYNGTTIIPNLNNLTVNGTLTVSEGIPLNFNVRGILIVNSGGKIDANGKGILTTGRSTYDSVGSGYGGSGGFSCNNYNNNCIALPNLVYGAYPSAIEFGSRNRDGYHLTYGGGKVLIKAMSTSLLGSIEANGLSGASGGAYGGASGGGIHIVSGGSVDGTKLFVKGGNASAPYDDYGTITYSGGGGGGRIFVQALNVASPTTANYAGGSGSGGFSVSTDGREGTYSLIGVYPTSGTIGGTGTGLRYGDPASATIYKWVNIKYFGRNISSTNKAKIQVRSADTWGAGDGGYVNPGVGDSSWYEITNNSGSIPISTSLAGAKTIEIRLELFGDGQGTPIIDDITVEPAALDTISLDTTAPVNISNLRVYENNTKSNLLTDHAKWYAYTAPYFEWDANVEADIKEYKYCFGTSASCTPDTSTSLVTNYTANLTAASDSAKYLRVIAIDNADNASQPVTMIYNFDKTLPGAVTGFTASNNDLTRIVLGWNAFIPGQGAPLDNYKLERVKNAVYEINLWDEYSNWSTGDGYAVFSLTSNGFTDDSANPAQGQVAIESSVKYIYRIAVKDQSNAQYSMPVNITGLTRDGKAPDDITGAKAAACDGTTDPITGTSVPRCSVIGNKGFEIALTWNVTPDVGTGVEKYYVYRATGAPDLPTSFAKVGETLAATNLYYDNDAANSVPASRLNDSSTYYYRVTAIDVAGNESGLLPTLDPTQNSASATTPDVTAPTVPADFTATAMGLDGSDPDANVTVASGSGTVSGSTTGTLSDSAKSWIENSMNGFTVKIISGLGANQSRAITANTGTQLTLSENWATNPDITSNYEIYGGHQRVQLTWSASTDIKARSAEAGSGVAGYRIYRANTVGGTYTDVSSDANVSCDFSQRICTNDRLAGFTNYYYQVRAFDNAVSAANYSSYSAPILAVTASDFVPGVPTSVTAVSVKGDPAQNTQVGRNISLTFVGSSDKIYQIVGYEVYRSTTNHSAVDDWLDPAKATRLKLSLNNGCGSRCYVIDSQGADVNIAPIQDDRNATYTIRDSGLTDAATYYYKVRAKDNTPAIPDGGPFYSGLSSISVGTPTVGWDITPDVTAPSIPLGGLEVKVQDTHPNEFELRNIVTWKMLTSSQQPKRNGVVDFSKYEVHREVIDPNNGTVVSDTNVGNVSTLGDNYLIDIIQIAFKDLKYKYYVVIVDNAAADFRYSNGTVVNAYSNYSAREYWSESIVPSQVKPVLVGDVTLSEVGVSTAIVGWITNQESDSLVQFRVKGSSDDWIAIGQVDRSLNHQVSLFGLTPTTEYEYQLVSRNYLGNNVEYDNGVLPALTTSGFTISAGTVSTTTSTTEITWTTNLDASSSFVEYQLQRQAGDEPQGGTAGVDPSVLSVSPRTHKVVLKGLRSARTYTYKIKSISKDGYLSEYPGGEFASFSTRSFDSEQFTLAPSSSNVAERNITATTAQIVWQTENPTTSWVDYSTTTGVYDNAAGNNDMTNTHVVVIEGLIPGTTYFYRVRVKDANEVEYTSKEYSFTAVLKPKISNMTVKDVTPYSVTISWDTNVDTETIINWGKTAAYGEKRGKSGVSKVHELTLDNLDDNSEYHYQILAKDGTGNEVADEDKIVRTPLDTEGPKIINAKIDILPMGENDTTSSVIISWQTNKPATTQVVYDEGIIGGKYNNQSTEDVSLNTSHTVIVKDLKPASSYHYRMVSMDKRSNKTESQDFTFVTPTKEKSILQMIIRSLEETFAWTKNLNQFFGNIGKRMTGKK